MRRIAPVVVVVLALSLIVGLSVRRYRASEADTGIYSGTIEAEESRVGSKVGGRVAELLVREGDDLNKGQLLLLFESDELTAKLNAAIASKRQAAAHLKDLEAGPRQPEIEQARAGAARAQDEFNKLSHGSRPEEIGAAKAAMEQSRERLRLLEAGPRKEDIDRARADYEAAQANRALADSTLQRIQALFKDGAVAAQTLDEAGNAAKTAAARERAAKKSLDVLLSGSRIEEIGAAKQVYNQAREAYALVKKGPRAEDLAAARHALDQARANLAYVEAGTRPHQIDQARSALQQTSAVVDQLRSQIRERAVFSPRSGRLQVLNVQAGDIVAAGQSIGTIIGPRDLYIRIYLSQRELGGLRVGDKLEVVTDSGLRATGAVSHIPVRAEFTPRNVQTREERALQVFAVKIRLSNPDLKLRAGMSADVRLPS